MRTALVTILLLAGVAVAEKKSSHPHFDDRGTVQWYTTMAEAKSAAAAAGKKIFIEFGREL